MTHRYQPAEYTARLAERRKVAANPGGENSVPQLRARIETLERAVGLRPVAK